MATQLNCKGYMNKSPPREDGLKRWRRRWFVLTEKELEYFEDSKKGSKKKGTIDLTSVQSLGDIKYISTRPEKPNIISIQTKQLTPNVVGEKDKKKGTREYLLEADSEESMKNWGEAVKNRVRAILNVDYISWSELNYNPEVYNSKIMRKESSCSIESGVSGSYVQILPNVNEDNSSGYQLVADIGLNTIRRIEKEHSNSKDDLRDDLEDSMENAINEINTNMMSENADNSEDGKKEFRKNFLSTASSISSMEYSLSPKQLDQNNNFTYKLSNEEESPISQKDSSNSDIYVQMSGAIGPKFNENKEGLDLGNNINGINKHDEPYYVIMNNLDNKDIQICLDLTKPNQISKTFQELEDELYSPKVMDADRNKKINAMLDEIIRGSKENVKSEQNTTQNSSKFLTLPVRPSSVPKAKSSDYDDIIILTEVPSTSNEEIAIRDETLHDEDQITAFDCEEKKTKSETVKFRANTDIKSTFFLESNDTSETKQVKPKIIPRKTKLSHSKSSLNPKSKKVLEIPKLPFLENNLNHHDNNIQIENVLGLKEELTKISYKKILESYWPMYIVLPDQSVHREIVNIDAPVKLMIIKFMTLFPQEANQNMFTLYVIGDLHQNWDIMSKQDREFKDDLRLEIDKSFSEQAITTSKFLQLITTVKIDPKSVILLKRDNSQKSLGVKFLETWVSFTRGLFTLPDTKEVANLVALIQHTYQSACGNETTDIIEEQAFMPRCAWNNQVCIKKIQIEREKLKEATANETCEKFLKRIQIWPTADTIAFQIKQIAKGSILKDKINERVIVIAKNHVGISKLNKITFDYDNFVFWWHKSELVSFELFQDKLELTLTLSRPIEDNQCEFRIKSSSAQSIFHVLNNYFKKVPLQLKRQSSVGRQTVQAVTTPRHGVDLEGLNMFPQQDN